jgi:hypothetical protein
LPRKLTLIELGESRSDDVNSRKKGEYLVGLDVVDTRDQFESASCNWQKIVDFVSVSGCVHCC